MAARFRQADVARALKGAQAAGFEVGAVEIADDGSIRIERAGKSTDNSPATPFDKWKARRDACPA